MSSSPKTSKNKASARVSSQSQQISTITVLISLISVVLVLWGGYYFFGRESDDPTPLIVQTQTFRTGLPNGGSILINVAYDLGMESDRVTKEDKDLFMKYLPGVDAVTKEAITSYNYESARKAGPEGVSDKIYKDVKSYIKRTNKPLSNKLKQVLLQEFLVSAD